MSELQYKLPEFLAGRLTRAQYARWLARKAAAHVKRDRVRRSPKIQLADYKQQIHAAVIACDGFDCYTGEELNWELISTYSNQDSKAARSKYKAGLALLPTVDHVAREDGSYDFVICGWRTNDAKNDLSSAEFVELCRRVILWHDSHAK
jgi:hypothetical protein